MRLQAADALAGSPNVSGEVAQEYSEYLLANADRPSGALKLASQAAVAGDANLVKRYGELAISFDRKNAAIRYDVAILLDRVGLGSEAIRHLRVAHGYDPNSGIYLFSQGLVLAGLGQLTEAADAMRRALRIEPTQDRWLYNLAVVQSRLGDVAGSRASLERALELAPGEVDYESFLGTLGGN